MNKISFEFISEHNEPFDDGHGEKFKVLIPDQIKILVDENNLLEDGYFGMYPFDFFSQDKHFYEGELQTGICGCSCYGCSDQFINVYTNGDMIVWTNENRSKYIFDKKEYTETINLFIKKYTTEEIYFKANKIILKELYNTETKKGYFYNMFMFYHYGQQIILYFKKDNEEEKHYIEFNNKTDMLLENINSFKKENIK